MIFIMYVDPFLWLVLMSLSGVLCLRVHAACVSDSDHCHCLCDNRGSIFLAEC